MKSVGCKLLVIAALWLALANSHGKTNEFRGAWVDAWKPELHTSGSISNLIRSMRGANMNAVVAQIRRRGDSLYNSNYEPWISELTASKFDALSNIIAQAHDTNAGPRVEVHAWIVTYPIWTGSTNSLQTNHPLYLHPDWLSRSNSITGPANTGGGNPGRPFDPGHPGVQRHTFNVAMDIISRYDIDGFNFDYIRYPEYGIENDQPQPWGYNPVSVARFNAKYGRTGQPLASDPEWTQFRRDQVSALVRKVYLSAMAIKPHVKISADTITWGHDGLTNTTDWPTSKAYGFVMQDWRGWLEEGILDLNLPMTYYRHHNTVEPQNHAKAFTNWSNFAMDHRYGRHLAIGPGIYLNSVSNAIVQLRHTRATTTNGNTAEGSCIYSFQVTNKDGVPNTTFLNALTNTSSYDSITPPLFTEPATIPEMPWKLAPTKGHLKGFITGGDSTNWLDGATLSITGTMNRNFVSDGTGFFGSVGLLPGAYTLTASFPGYQPFITNFTVTAGVVTTRDLILQPYVINIVDQPQSQTVAIGGSAQFTVTATGDTPLSFQWKFNGTNIAEGTGSSYSIGNVQPSHAGTYSVVITNSYTSATSSNAILTVLMPPSITTHPLSQTVAPGNEIVMKAFAIGAAPLTYQWTCNGSNIAGATLNTFTKSNAQTNDTGFYAVTVQNGVGTATSSNALAVITTQPKFSFTNLWSIPAGSRSYVTTTNTERGLAYNPATDHVLVVSRFRDLPNGLSIAVLDASTGNELGMMDVTSITNNGAFRLNKIDVAEDGVIYGANLTTASTSAPLVIYRWENENSVPTIAYSGDVANSRWGDSFIVRGAGLNTEILVSGSGNTTTLLHLTTANGTSFTARQLFFNGASLGEFSKGLAWGPGETFYSKRNIYDYAMNCRYSLASNTVVSLPGVRPLDLMMIAIDVSTNHNLLFGLVDNNTTNPNGHVLRVHSMIGGTNSTEILASFQFPTNTSGTYSNNANFAGAVEFDGTRVFALDTQNGIIAAKVTPVIQPTIAALSLNDRVHLQLDRVPPGLTFEGSSDLIFWSPLTNFLFTNGAFSVVDPVTNSPHRYYRSKHE